MSAILIQLISIIANLITLLVIVDAVLSFVMPPYHPVRETMGRVLTPLYAPIRRVIPPLGMLDITPLVLILLIQVVQTLLISILRSF
jgi:YggT family protein